MMVLSFWPQIVFQSILHLLLSPAVCVTSFSSEKSLHPSQLSLQFSPVPLCRLSVKRFLCVYVLIEQRESPISRFCVFSLTNVDCLFWWVGEGGGGFFVLSLQCYILPTLRVLTC